jgi:hypothetical protein
MFIGNSQNYARLEAWISRSQESHEKLQYKHVCIVTGESGIGKTFGIEKAIAASNRTLYKMNEMECTNSKDFRDLIYKITSSHIVSQIEKISIEDKIIWIDDLDSFLIFDRTFLHTLQDLLENASTPAIKIIISTNSADMKHYGKFYKHGLVLQLQVPDSADVIIFLRKTYPKLSVQRITDIAEFTNGNISAAIQLATIEMKVKVKGRSKIKKEPVELSSNDNIPKLVHLFDIPYKISVGKFLFDQDPWLHPLRFHENLLNEWNIRKGLQKHKEETYITILQLFCEWDQMMSYAKTTDANDMSVAIELSAYIPSFMNDFPKKKNAVSSMDEFTRMFNYLSLKKKNAVALYTTDFPWITVGSYHKHFYDDKNKNKPKNFST